MKITDDLLMDTRLVDRNMTKGLVERAAYQKHLDDLPDLTDTAAVLEVEMSDVGVGHAEAKDTGDHD
jgi:hypothetical protein